MADIAHPSPNQSLMVYAIPRIGMGIKDIGSTNANAIDNSN